MASYTLAVMWLFGWLILLFRLLSYGITDYSIRIGYPANLIIRCKTGIDSLELNVDTTIFKVHVDLYSINGKVTNPTEEEKKIICHTYKL